MASENVELVQRLYECFQERDHATAFELYAEDIEWVMPSGGPIDIGGTYRGHDGVRQFWREWLAAWREIDWEDEEFTELADGRVRVQVKQRNRGRETGIWVEQPRYEQLWTLVDGKVTHMEFHWLD